jgi:L-alanine-DL-glutamate epimerase-like enolase superfamily enzyme
VASVVSVEVRAVGPGVDRFTWADQPPQYLTWALVVVRDDEGYAGCALTLAYSAGMFDLSIFEALRPRAVQLVGRDADSPEAAWHALQELNIPLPPGVHSVLDIALWDLHARREKMPLYRLLGGSRSRALAYASTPQLEGDEDYLELVDSLASQGFRAVKFHAWNEVERDLAMLRRVHATHGSSALMFMHDAEMRYDRADALRAGRELQEMGFRWFEAPLHDFDLPGYRALRDALSIAILPAGHWITDPTLFAQAVDPSAWSSVRFDVTVAGGITACRNLLQIAKAAGLDAEIQSWGPTLLQAPNLHLALAAHGEGLFECPVPTEAYEFAALNPLRIDASGHVTAPTGDGLGIELDWEKIESATIRAFECTSDGIKDRAGAARAVAGGAAT